MNAIFLMVLARNSKFFILFFFLVSCRTGEKPQVNEAEVKERLTEVNRLLVKDERKEIEDFINRHQFKMIMNGTGLNIQVLDSGVGRKPNLHDEIELEYSLYLLDGTLCYSAKVNQPLRFRIGEGQQPRGLEDALFTFKEGTKARLIVPSHLAFGITGDGDKIPGANALYYELHLLKIKS
ncbi:MAG: FKBP-type peptidyl-prolyl cis-trans isomerase [Bacteroidia bacterium]